MEKTGNGIVIPVVAIAVLLLLAPRVDLTGTEPLPGDPTFSEDATLSVEDNSFANIQMHSFRDGILYIHASDYGKTTITIRDGEKEYRYTVEVYRDNGVARTRITPLE